MTKDQQIDHLNGCLNQQLKTIEMLQQQIAKKTTPKSKSTPIIKNIPQNGRRICIICGRKRDIKYMVLSETQRGRYFQAGKEIQLYHCKPDIMDRDCLQSNYRFHRY